MNPFFAASTLPFEAPPFDRIKDDDYEPAFAEGMKQGLAEHAAIASSTEPPTFANTIAAMEVAARLLERVSAAFFGVTSANTNPALQAMQTRLAPQLAEYSDAINLDPQLYARIHAVFEARSSLSPEDRYLAERYERDFVRSGANLSDADKTTLRALNKELSSLTTEFSERLLAATTAGAVVTSEVSDLAGLDEGEVAAAAEAARERHAAGATGSTTTPGYVLPLQNTTQQPVQVALENRKTRETLFRASTQRSERGDANDSRELVRKIAAARARKAKLLGYPSYAAYALVDQMAKTPEQATRLLTDMVPAAVQRARSEAAKMQSLADAEAARDGRPPFPLAAWDWQHYADKVRSAEFAFDDAQVKPYLELDRVLKDGVFLAAHELYGFSFTERTDIPVYHPDVRVFTVTDESGEPFALFYGDYFHRDNKQGGAWMGGFVGQSTLLGTGPVVYNVCNFTKPVAGQPALLSFDDVITLFHEFGHAIHGLSSKVKYPSLSGTAVPRDFVEFPSQFNENWATHPRILGAYAKHWKTGAPMPADLLAKVQKARQFNQGFTTSEYLAAAFLDMAWHTRSEDEPSPDVGEFETRTLARHGVANPLVPPRYRTTYFEHVWGGGYAAGYYAYLWAEVLDHDAYAWFEENGGLTRANGKRLQEMILSRGYTEPLDLMYKNFRGREPRVEPLLAFRGLNHGS